MEESYGDLIKRIDHNTGSFVRSRSVRIKEPRVDYSADTFDLGLAGFAPYQPSKHEFVSPHFRPPANLELPSAVGGILDGMTHDELFLAHYVTRFISQGGSHHKLAAFIQAIGDLPHAEINAIRDAIRRSLNM